MTHRDGFMPTRQNRVAQFRWWLTVALIAGCGEEGTLTPGGSVAEDVASAHDVPTPDVPTSDTPVAEPRAARIVLDVPDQLPLGQSVQLSATLEDADGGPLDGPVYWSTTNGRGLSVSPTGLATPGQPGFYGVTAYRGGVQSETVWIRVVDPTPEIRVDVPVTYDAGPGRLVKWVLSDEASSEAASMISLSQSRGGLLIGLDVDSELPLLLVVGSGAPPKDGVAPSIHATFTTTAEAVLMIACGFPLESLDALDALRSLMATAPAEVNALIAALEQLSAGGGSWASRLDALAPVAFRASEVVMAEAERRLTEASRRRDGPAGKPSGGKADTAVDATLPKIRVAPDLLTSGVEVSTAGCDPLPSAVDLREQCGALPAAERAAHFVLKITNGYGRFLASQLTDLDGQRVLGPLYQGGVTYIPGLFRVLGGLLTPIDEEKGELRFMSSSNLYRLVPRSFVSGTERLALHVVGWGLRSSSIPMGSIQEEDFFELTTAAWTFSLTFSVALPLINGLAGVPIDTTLHPDLKSLKDLMGVVGKICKALGLGIASADAAVGGGSDGKVGYALFELAWSLYLKNVVFGWLNGNGLGALAEKLTLVFGVYGAVSALGNVALNIIDFVVSPRGLAFYVDEAAQITPLEPTLPAGYEGCTYSFTLEASEAGSMDWQWAVAPSKQPDDGKWNFVPEGPGKRRLTVFLADTPSTPGRLTRDEDQTIFSIALSQPVSGVVDHHTSYLLEVQPALTEVVVTASNSTAAWAFRPGEPLRITATIPDCHDGEAGGGTLTAEIPGLLAGTAALVGTEETGVGRRLTFEGVAAPVIVDRRYPPGAFRLVIEPTFADASVSLPALDVLNAPPSGTVTSPPALGGGAAVRVMPGQPIQFTLWVDDPNMDPTWTDGKARPWLEVPESGLWMRAPAAENVDAAVRTMRFAYTGATGSLGHAAEPVGTIVLGSGTLDNDGPSALDTPYRIEMTIRDDDLAVASPLPVLTITVADVPPTLTAATSTLEVTEASPAQLDIALTASDANGAGDLGSVSVSAVAGGSSGSTPFGAVVLPGESTLTERVYTLRLSTAQIRSGCESPCTLQLQIADRDDPVPSAPVTITITVDGLGPCAPDGTCAPACLPNGTLSQPICVAGLCQPGQVTDCTASGLACYAAACRRTCDEPSDCGAGSDRECLDSDTVREWECTAGHCFESDTDCGGGLQCPPADPSCRAPCSEATPCVNQCLGKTVVLNLTCTSGYCYEDMAQGVETCPTETVCQAGACVEACKETSDCSLGGAPFCDIDGATIIEVTCQGGACVAAPTISCIAPYVCKQGDCDPAPDSCLERCGVVTPNAPCQCDAECTTRGDCCADRLTVCPECKVDEDCPDGGTLTCDEDAVTVLRIGCVGGECLSVPELSCVEPFGCVAGDCIDVSPSCEGRCGYGGPDVLCKCDASCMDVGDCCADYEALCVECSDTKACADEGALSCSPDGATVLRVGCDGGACKPMPHESCVSGSLCEAGACVESPGTSCVGRCGTRDAGASCQCDTACAAAGDCCEDLAYECTSCGSHLDCADDGAPFCNTKGDGVQKEVCDQGYCRRLAILACPGESVCEGGACSGIACESDLDCPGQGYNNICVDDTTTSTYECSDGVCKASLGQCGLGLHCLEGSPFCVKECQATADCPGGGEPTCAADCEKLALLHPGVPCLHATLRYTCDTGAGRCKEVLPFNFCGGGQVCEDGACITPPECEVDSDCPGAGALTCSSDGTTVVTPACVEGLCTDLPYESCLAPAVCDGGTCAEPVLSCKDRCGDGSGACRCDPECVTDGSCCDDFEAHCTPCEGDDVSTCPGGGVKTCGPDGDSVLTPVCVEGLCTTTAAGCAGAKVCHQGACAVPCTDDFLCDDGNLCTENACVSGYCKIVSEVQCVPNPFGGGGTCNPKTGACQ